jgi:hypothetical protein
MNTKLGQAFYVEGVKVAYHQMYGYMPEGYGQAVQQGAAEGPDTIGKIRTALRGVGGGVAGGLGGAAAGAGLGLGGGHLAKLLGADMSEDDIRKAMIYGGLLGGGLGAGAGATGGGVLPSLEND